MTASSTRRKRGQRTVTAWQRSRWRAVIKGPVAIVHPVLRANDVPWEWDPKAGAYIIPLNKFGAVLTALEMAGHRVDFIAGRHFRWSGSGSLPAAPPPDALW